MLESSTVKSLKYYASNFLGGRRVDT